MHLKESKMPVVVFASKEENLYFIEIKKIYIQEKKNITCTKAPIYVNTEIVKFC